MNGFFEHGSHEYRLHLGVGMVKVKAKRNKILIAASRVLAFEIINKSLDRREIQRKKYQRH